MSVSGHNVELAARIGRRLCWRLPTAHLAGALLAAGSGALTAANIEGQPGFTRWDALTLAGYLLITSSLGMWTGPKVFWRG
ncbi:MAG TPA: hypothetical protein VFE40_09575, partial [Jatrophihabitantaceae bacterium]|nr:hypothetical protein [Jatrophihabitantaceae bacterium]